MRDRKIRHDNEAGGHHGDHKGRHHQGAEGAGSEEARPQDRGERRHGRHGGGRDRARRGAARYILLDALRDGPKHGYEIIKALEERSSGRYIPSPGTVYPTLQYLEDQGLVRANQEAERRIYQLTEAGQAELAALAEQVTAFWGRFAEPGVAATSQPEVSFLQDELEHLNRIVWNGLRTAIAQGQQEPIRRMRTVIEECQNKIREIISTDKSATDKSATDKSATEQTQ